MHHPKIETLRRASLSDPARASTPARSTRASSRATSTSSSAGTTSSPCTTTPSRSIEAERSRLRAARARARRRAGQPAAPDRRSAWSTTTARRWTRSRSGSKQLETRGVQAAEAQPAARDPRPQGGHRLAAARDAAAARRHRPARAARVPADLRDAGVPLPRRLRPPRPADRRGAVPAGPRHRAARRVPVDAVESAESGHEGADRDRDDLHAADRAHRHVRHERRAAAISRAATPRSSGGLSASWS